MPSEADVIWGWGRKRKTLINIQNSRTIWHHVLAGGRSPSQVATAGSSRQPCSVRAGFAAGWIIEIPMICWQLWTFQRAQGAELVSAEVGKHFSPPFHACFMHTGSGSHCLLTGVGNVMPGCPKHKGVPRFTGKHLAIKEAGAILTGIFCLLCPV